jgi:hypothetical protein
MNKEFVPYEQALALKELGIEVKSPYWYNPNGVLLMKSFECDDETISVNVKNIIEYWDGVIKDRIDVPTFSQAFRFFREKYDLDYEITYGGKKGKYCAFVKSYIYGNNGNNPSIFSYEEAELECLIKLIEIVKEIK